MRKDQSKSSLLGFLALVVLAVAAVFVVRTVAFGTPSAIVTAAIALGSALVIQAVTSASQRRREIEADQRKEKAKVYESFMDLWFDDVVLPLLMAKNQNSESNRTSEDLLRKMGSFTKKVILWGSDDVVKEYSAYRKSLSGQSQGRVKPIDPKMAGLARLFFAFRRDLGYGNRGLQEHDLLALFINDLHERPNDSGMESSESTES